MTASEKETSVIRGSLPRFKVIAAIDENRGLGLEGELPWHLPEDLKHFARTTTETQNEGAENAVIMGRLTAEAIPRKYWPLKKRRNAVITRNPDWSAEGADVFTSLPAALEGLADSAETLYVVGGGQIYTLATQMEECEELILTRIHKRYDCDAIFPEFMNHFELVEALGSGQHEGVGYTFERWCRRSTE